MVQVQESRLHCTLSGVTTSRVALGACWGRLGFKRHTASEAFVGKARSTIVQWQMPKCAGN
jgi:hypothetical protein